MNPIRLAVVAGHPVQYVAPWLTQLAEVNNLEVHVFYLWDFGVVETRDPGFGITLEWDIPLLEGYSYSFLRNHAKDPGNHHFMGYVNPALAGKISDWKPDVIFLMNYAFLSYFLLLADPRLWRKPILFRGDSHDVGRSKALKPFLAKMLRRTVFSRFSAFLDVGKNNRDYLLASGVSPRRIFHAPHAIDNQRFRMARPRAFEGAKELRSELGISEEKVLICFVGKLIAVKRPLDLLNAFAALPKELARKAALLFVGDGKLKSHLQAAGNRIESLHFLPFQNQSNMPSVYAAADLLVLPSQSETWGLVVNEAMNMSCPVLVSDHVGCAPDLVIPDETGWIFPTGDVKALIHYLTLAISQPNHLGQMGRNASTRIEQFSFESLTAGLLEAVNFVVKDQHLDHPSRRLKSAKILA